MMNEIVAILDEYYPNPKASLNFNNLYQLVISVLLSAQTTDKAVNKVTPFLFAKYSSFASLSESNYDDIYDLIKTLGLAKTKAKHLLELGNTLKDTEFPKEFNEMIKLPGIGNKTASVICIEYFDLPLCPVDTHVFRISHRLGISNDKTPEKTQETIQNYFDKSVLKKLHHQLIYFGREICTAQKPKCDICKLKDYCKEYLNTHIK